MGYKIGIDFGTTNSMVSYINSSNRLEALEYPGPELGVKYIPSCVAYEPDGSVSIGLAALTVAGNPGVIFCNNMKMILPLSEKDRAKYGWPEGKNPENVIADYFAHILTLEDEYASSFRTLKEDKIDGIVLSVPHVWAKDPLHAGRRRLETILTDDLNLPLIQLISEPVAAAAYYAYKYQQDTSKIFNGNLLICDVGGGTFDVTLCRVEPGKVEELYNDGNGESGLGKTGVFFDRYLIFEGNKEKGQSVDETSRNFFKLYEELQAFKIRRHSNITKNIITAIEDPDIRDDMPIMKAGELEFKFLAVKKAFEEVESGINNVLQRFKAAIDEKSYSIDAISLVGGFADFYLVREAIKKFWNIMENDPRFSEAINKEISRFAISYGATLVANGIVSVEEKYEHTIGILTKTTVISEIEGHIEIKEQKTKIIPIIEGGKKLSEYEDFQWAENLIKPIHDQNDKPDVVIYVDRGSRGSVIKKKLPKSLNIRLPDPGIPGYKQYKIGMRVNKSKLVYLVFENRLGEKSEEYELGDILRQMFGGLEIIQAERE